MYCKDSYRLELHWDKVEYHNDFTAFLRGAYFSGPILKSAQKIKDEDSINIDLTPQHIVVLNSYYIIKLEWGSVNYHNGIAALDKAVITNEHLKELHKLEDRDFIVINTEKHEHTTHAFNLVYVAEVMRQDKKPHTYTK